MLRKLCCQEEKAKHDLWFNAKMINESYKRKGNLLKETAVTLNLQAKEFQPTMQQPLTQQMIYGSMKK